MQDDCIAVTLGLPQLKILEQKELADRFEVVVICRQQEAACPRYGMVTAKEHDKRRQIKLDRRLRDKLVYLVLMKRRFRCLWCGKVFTESEEVFGCRRRSTYRFREHLGREALHQTVKGIAQKEQVGEGLVRRCVAEEIGRRLGARPLTEAPEFIGRDEFSVRRRRLYHTAICDLVKGEVMEAIERASEPICSRIGTPCLRELRGLPMGRRQGLLSYSAAILKWKGLGGSRRAFGHGIKNQGEIRLRRSSDYWKRG